MPILVIWGKVNCLLQRATYVGTILSTPDKPHISLSSFLTYRVFRRLPVPIQLRVDTVQIEMPNPCPRSLMEWRPQHSGRSSRRTGTSDSHRRKHKHNS